MPQAGAKRADAPTDEERARIVSGPDESRFYCPHPGCNRSFAELWRLKVHFRAPPDVRGSGKERGHGTELKFCPKCGKDLRPGKHHVGCSAGKSAPRQAAKRQRQQMSTTTESKEALTAGTTAGTEQTSGSWELAVRRQAAKMQQQQASEAESTQRGKRADACRLEALAHNLENGGGGGNDQLYQHHSAAAGVVAAGGHAGPHAGSSDAAAMPHHFFPMVSAGNGVMTFDALPHAAPAAAPAGPSHHMQQQQAAAHQQQQYAQQQHVQQQPAPLPHLDLPQHANGLQQRSISPSPLDLFADPFGGGMGGGGGHDGNGHDGNGHHHHQQEEGNGQSHLQQQLHHHDFLDEHDMLRIPSPPPLPADWDTAPRAGLLFDFDQFDISKRQQTGGASAPLVTVTTAMNPVDVLNPSDDYIWQILFAGENDAVPKRVTAHLHHPPALSYLDEADPLLDAILSDDLGMHHHQQQAQQGGGQQAHHEQEQQVPQQHHVPGEQARGHAQPAQHGAGGGGGLLPMPSNAGGACGAQQHALMPSLDAVFHHQQQHYQQQQHHDSHGLLPSSAGGPAVCMVQQAALQQYRNGFGSHGGDMMPAVKMEGSSFLL